MGREPMGTHGVDAKRVGPDKHAADVGIQSEQTVGLEAFVPANTSEKKINLQRRHRHYRLCLGALLVRQSLTSTGGWRTWP